jgi:hypothetical protein
MTLSLCHLGRLLEDGNKCYFFNLLKPILSYTTLLYLNFVYANKYSQWIKNLERPDTTIHHNLS